MTEGIDWGTFPQWVSAGAALGGLGVAIWAAGSWRRTLTAKRGDDLIAAAHEVAAAIGILRDAMKRGVSKPLLGSKIDTVYECLKAAGKALTIAERSYKDKLPNTMLDDLRSSVDAIKDEIESNHEILSQYAPDITFAIADGIGASAQAAAGSFYASVLKVVRSER